jgi:hypothetical protein
MVVANACHGDYVCDLNTGLQWIWDLQKEPGCTYCW